MVPEAARSFADLLPEPCLLVARDGTVACANRAAARALGAPGDGIEGRALAGLVEQSPDAVAAYLRACLRTPEASIGALTFATPGGERVKFRVEGRMYRAHAAAPPCALLRLTPKAAAVDRFLALNERLGELAAEIVRRKRLERELAHKVADLAEADRRKDQFLAMLSHELRNPLAPLRTGVQLLRMLDVPDPNARTTLAMMERQVAHVARLVDDLMDVSRVSSGKIRLRLARLPLHEIAEQALAMARPRLEAQGQPIELDIASDAMIEADAARLVQVVANLLDNASKYSPRGAPVTLCVRCEDGMAVIAVRDRGQGIAPELLPRVFDLFLQGDTSLDRPRGGLGVGLALVKTLVQMHGGRVSAASEGPGLGAEFTVRLPLAASPLRAAIAGSDTQAAALPAAGGAPRRILVVDDNLDARTTIARLLEMWGHHVRCAEDGPTAVAEVTRSRFDVAILDIGLPGMNGYELARKVREMEGGPPRLVALTGYGREEDRQRARMAGFDLHLTKPVDPRELQEVLAAGSSVDSAAGTELPTPAPH